MHPDACAKSSYEQQKSIQINTLLLEQIISLDVSSAVSTLFHERGITVDAAVQTAWCQEIMKRVTMSVLESDSPLSLLPEHLNQCMRQAIDQLISFLHAP